MNVIKQPNNVKTVYFDIVGRNECADWAFEFDLGFVVDLDDLDIDTDDDDGDDNDSSLLYVCDASMILNNL